MTIASDHLRRLAAEMDDVLEPVWALRAFPKWTGPAAQRFDVELHRHRALLAALSTEAALVAIHMDKEVA
ncbi:hypothetical protein [Herbidospora mongoliensis]|uniref:hypothetical protein n=1 Tax=Herbidospora mongoliensis TaxID=688067 RepID=UPI0008367DDF|nr:hypothetical protein [Herbidospora mongoliensis]